MRAAYLQAAIPEPYVILGLRLKPFCLGHELLLQRFGSGFSTASNHSPTALFEDLVLTVLVCSHSYEQAIAILASPWLGLRMKLWGWKIRLRGMDLLSAVSLLREYISSASAAPEYWLEETKGKVNPSGSPFIQHLKVTLMSCLHMSQTEALNLPFGEAVWNYLTYWESQGRIQLMTEAEQQLIEQANGLKP